MTSITADSKLSLRWTDSSHHEHILYKWHVLGLVRDGTCFGTVHVNDNGVLKEITSFSVVLKPNDIAAVWHEATALSSMAFDEPIGDCDGVLVLRPADSDIVLYWYRADNEDSGSRQFRRIVDVLTLYIRSTYPM